MERAIRTLRESMDGVDLQNRHQAEEELGKIIVRYNQERFHSSLGFKPPVVYYRGNPEAIDEQRQLKLRQARHRRKEANLKLNQRMVPLQPIDNELSLRFVPLTAETNQMLISAAPIRCSQSRKASLSRCTTEDRSPRSTAVPTKTSN